VLELGGALARYARTVLAKWPVTVPGVAFAVLSVIDAARKPSDQIVLPPLVWLVVAMACAIVAQFLVWRDLWIEPVEEAHGQMLRDLGKRLHGQLDAANDPSYSNESAWTPEHIFQAHFPGTAAEIAAYGQALRDERETYSALMETIRLAAFDRFGTVEGWYWGAVFNRSKTHLLEILVGGEIDVAASSGSALVWVTAVVYDGADPQEAEQMLRGWLREVATWPDAAAYRGARAERAARQVHGIAILDPLLHELPIRKARSCAICFPPNPAF
jgi:hypothetical protein